VLNTQYLGRLIAITGAVALLIDVFIKHYLSVVYSAPDKNYVENKGVSMEFFIFVLVIAGIYFYLKGNKSESNFKSPDSSYKRNSNSYARNKSTHSGGSYEIGLVEGNKLLIENAISSGKKIAFKYKDKSDQVTQRTVTPQRIFWYQFDEREGQMLCLEAFCHLRNSSRTFALFRMTQIKLTA